MAWDDTLTSQKHENLKKNMTPCHGSTYSAKLSSHQSGPDTENLFSQQ